MPSGTVRTVMPAIEKRTSDRDSKEMIDLVALLDKGEEVLQRAHRVCESVEEKLQSLAHRQEKPRMGYSSDLFPSQ